MVTTLSHVPEAQSKIQKQLKCTEDTTEGWIQREGKVMELTSDWYYREWVYLRTPKYYDD